jgi:hypothetical protein
MLGRPEMEEETTWTLLLEMRVAVATWASCLERGSEQPVVHARWGGLNPIYRLCEVLDLIRMQYPHQQTTYLRFSPSYNMQESRRLIV